MERRTTTGRGRSDRLLLRPGQVRDFPVRFCRIPQFSPADELHPGTRRTFRTTSRELSIFSALCRTEGGAGGSRVQESVTDSVTKKNSTPILAMNQTRVATIVRRQKADNYIHFRGTTTFHKPLFERGSMLLSAQYAKNDCSKLGHEIRGVPLRTPQIGLLRVSPK